MDTTFHNVRVLSLQLQQQRIEFTAGGLFAIDHGLMFNVSMNKPSSWELAPTLGFPPAQRNRSVKYLPSVIVFHFHNPRPQPGRSLCHRTQIVGSLATYLLILIQFDIAQNGAKWKSDPTERPAADGRP
ncbi:AGAP007756-PA-like protein [Anopheles sinensis]|uniref:AGAP007756-PA-like protein n=1 Tax=Anopheles sinensis TaxID=74873 RepID=A0A084W7M8_ANOSI|nr:AGAP007756-PA-like protein [Anopheles sinensis]